jgi:hypothetical protein
MIGQLIQMLDNMNQFIEDGGLQDSPNIKSQVMLAEELKKLEVEDSLAEEIAIKTKLSISAGSFNDPKFPELIQKYAQFIVAMLHAIPEQVQPQFPNLDTDTLLEAVLASGHLEA